MFEARLPVQNPVDFNTNLFGLLLNTETGLMAFIEKLATLCRHFFSLNEFVTTA